ncbi:MAG TPA: DUF1345 domain-containing protein [Dermatophilaceae bacterium]|nr:DUF1345 domain-containing protein [Dermatophilaceae bacterium]
MAGSSSRARLLASFVVGVVVALLAAALGGGRAAPLLGWDALALAYSTSVWLSVRGYDAATTAAHSKRDNPSRRSADLVVVTAAVASLVGVGVLLLGTGSKGGSGGGAVLEGLLGLLSVGASWLLVHTLFTLEYARLYYEEPVGGVDFNSDERPTYRDFAYLAFTLGMTYQVSDTSIGSSAVRAVALRHALLSYVFGAVIIAATINLLVGLANR